MQCTDFGVPLNPDDFQTESKLDEEEATVPPMPTENSNESIAKKLRCWHHLQKIYLNALHKYNADLKHGERGIEENLPIILCGFSKGCVILNQLCSELEYADFKGEHVNEFTEVEAESNEACLSFSQQIRHVIWLDGGHSGTKNSWITREEIVLLIKHLKWSCYVYVTPYQIKSRKYWAVEEYTKFIDLLKSLDVVLKHVYYFEEKEDDFDVDVHFEVLTKFDTFLI